MTNKFQANVNNQLMAQQFETEGSIILRTRADDKTFCWLCIVLVCDVANTLSVSNRLTKTTNGKNHFLSESSYGIAIDGGGGSGGGWSLCSICY